MVKLILLKRGAAEHEYPAEGEKRLSATTAKGKGIAAETREFLRRALEVRVNTFASVALRRCAFLPREALFEPPFFLPK